METIIDLYFAYTDTNVKMFSYLVNVLETVKGFKSTIFVMLIK